MSTFHAPTIQDYASRMGVEVGDMADVFHHAFFALKKDTIEISLLYGVPEYIVFNALHAYREAGRRAP